FYSDHIQGAGLVRCLRAPITALLVAGRERLGPGEGDDVEVPVAQAVLVLRFVDGAHGNCYAEPLQRRLEEQEHPFEAWIGGGEFDRERLPPLWVGKLLGAPPRNGLFFQFVAFSPIVPRLLC